MEEKNPIKEKELKPRSDKYEEKVSFDGTFDELLDLTVRPKKEVKTARATDR